MHKLTVGIITYNSSDDIDACLQRLEKQTYQDFAVLILDNASTDGTADLVAEHWAQHRLIRREDNIGFGNGHNQIIANTSSDYYLPLNPDVILTNTYLEEMVKVVESDEDIGSVAGKLYFFEDEADIENPAITKKVYTAGHAVLRDGFALNIGYKEADDPKYQIKREVFGANAAAPLYRRTMLNDIQFEPNEFFDKSIFLYHEDADLDWRARLLGWKCVFTPHAIGYHAQDKSGGIHILWIIDMITAVRYYSIFKHAFLIDLITFNIPAFIFHVVFMLITEPRRGIATIRFILTHMNEIRRKRAWLATHRRINRQQLQQWYTWSAQQTQANHYFARFWRGKILKQNGA